MALILGLILYCNLDYKIEILSSVLITGISISFGVKNYKIANDKVFKELFTSFNNKYDKRFNNFLNGIEKKCQVDQNFSLEKSDESIVIDYLNLCAEEYLWYRKNRIDPAVWASWEAGMTYYMSLPPINRIVQMEYRQKDSYYGLFNIIGSKIPGWEK